MVRNKLPTYFLPWLDIRGATAWKQVNKGLLETLMEENISVLSGVLFYWGLLGPDNMVKASGQLRHWILLTRQEGEDSVPVYRWRHQPCVKSVSRGRQHGEAWDPGPDVGGLTVKSPRSNQLTETPKKIRSKWEKPQFIIRLTGFSKFGFTNRVDSWPNKLEHSWHNV